MGAKTTIKGQKKRKDMNELNTIVENVLGGDLIIGIVENINNSLLDLQAKADISNKARYNPIDASEYIRYLCTYLYCGINDKMTVKALYKSKQDYFLPQRRFSTINSSIEDFGLFQDVFDTLFDNIKANYISLVGRFIALDEGLYFYSGKEHWVYLYIIF